MVGNYHRGGRSKERTSAAGRREIVERSRGKKKKKKSPQKNETQECGRKVSD